MRREETAPERRADEGDIEQRMAGVRGWERARSVSGRLGLKVAM